ncbi:hypothetical protein NDK25_00455 [Niallia taxi]|nr:hypothetical protein [Niallia taxi]MDE5050882.1 hypothetical protein [Niallia taxi]
MMDKKYEDTGFEGREKAYVDIDRMINEGLSGGKVFRHDSTANIEEARELAEEDPPHVSE